MFQADTSLHGFTYKCSNIHLKKKVNITIFNLIFISAFDMYGPFSFLSSKRSLNAQYEQDLN